MTKNKSNKLIRIVTIALIIVTAISIISVTASAETTTATKKAMFQKTNTCTQTSIMTAFLMRTTSKNCSDISLKKNSLQKLFCSAKEVHLTPILMAPSTSMMQLLIND